MNGKNEDADKAPRHTLNAIADSLAAIELSLEELLRQGCKTRDRLGRIEEKLSKWASPADLERISKELAENQEKLKAAQLPPSS